MADDGLRYERKFVVRGFPTTHVEQHVRLHPARFREIYHRRYVNNCYFDTGDLAAYRDAVEGNPRRMKVRVRWYGPLFGPIERPVLEIKTKRGPVGGKAQFTLAPTALDRSGRGGTLAAWVEGAKLPPELDVLRPLRAALINRYGRRYYEAADPRFRLTVDDELEYYTVTPPVRRFATLEDDPLTTILELKYGREADDDAPSIADRLGYRMTKSSKYVEGMRRLGRR